MRSLGLWCALIVAASSSAAVSAWTSTTSSRISLRSPPLSSRRRLVNSSSGPRLCQSRLFAESVDELQARAAKAREEYNKLREARGKNTTDDKNGAVNKKSPDQVKELLPKLINDFDPGKQADTWNELKTTNSLTAFASANVQTFPVSLNLLTQRTSLTAASIGLDDTAVDLDDFKYATVAVTLGSSVVGVLALAFLPPNIGATVCYAAALLPILFLGVGSSAPGAIANVLAKLKGTAREEVAMAERRTRHEAAHFCCGYWCGLPVVGYSTANGIARVEFGRGSGSSFSNTQVAALAVTALSGLVAEAMEYGQAQGAQQDLVALETVFRNANEFMRSDVQQDITRWGALTAYTLLQGNKAKYEQIVEAFLRQAPIDECITILESM